MSFSGKKRDFLGMLLKGSLLQIPTFGFYRFWLITKLRRHLWANTQVGGDSFEYTGTGRELLVGFLIALAVLTPLYLLSFLATVLLEEMAPLASVPLILVMYVLMHFGAYRARRYRATRTVFRGVRFWMKGSGLAYALRAVLWDIAVILTVGLALPWATASLERYRMRHTSFGSVPGEFTGTGWGLFKCGWWMWALGIAAICGAAALMMRTDFTNKEAASRTVGAVFGLLTLFYIAIVPAVLAIFTRWQIGGLHFGGATLSSTLRIRSCYGLFLKWLGSSVVVMVVWAVAIAGIAAAFAAFFQQAAFDLKNGSMTAGAATMLALVVIGYLALLFGMGIIQRYFMGRGLWALIVNSTAITNIRSLDTAIAGGAPAGSMGEGLADALEFDIAI